MAFKRLPIGVDNFKKIREDGLFYVDKTLLIKDLLDHRGEVNLFTRPRRFGKTLNLSMLQYFFEQREEDCSHLFSGLKIVEAGEVYTKYQGHYPVIKLSLKSAKQRDYQTAYEKLREEIKMEFQRHHLVASVLPEADQKRYYRTEDYIATESEYSGALKFLTECLYTYYKKKVIVLIDEYDVPLESAYFGGYYEDMVEFIRSLFESALKSNDCLEFSVITGCLRISKESIFTGLNNFKMISITNSLYAEHFGFTANEVVSILHFYGIDEHSEIVKEWYDGYLFGKMKVYNPWSVLNYVDTCYTDSEALPTPYWSNVSSNNIVRDLVQSADARTKSDLEDLIAGNEIEKPIREDITYDDVYSTQDNLWNFLYFTGYLTKVSEVLRGVTRYMKLAIPNKEVQYIYENTINEWFNQFVKKENLQPLFHALFIGDTLTLQECLNNLLIKSISFYDYAENFYHGVLLGALSNIQNCVVTSNRESGLGRYDIQIENPVLVQPSIIIEVKVTRDFKELDSLAEKALAQIEKQKYDATLRRNGHENIIKYGIAFQAKQCRVHYSMEESA